MLWLFFPQFPHVLWYDILLCHNSDCKTQFKWDLSLENALTKYSILGFGGLPNRSFFSCSKHFYLENNFYPSKIFCRPFNSKRLFFLKYKCWYNLKLQIPKSDVTFLHYMLNLLYLFKFLKSWDIIPYSNNIIKIYHLSFLDSQSRSLSFQWKTMTR